MSHASRSLGMALFAVFLMTAAAPEQKPLEIFFIDVLGGAATLIVTPSGESMLIDSGWPGNDDRDAKRIEDVLFHVARMDHLDHLVTTHWHMDHYGGVAGLARRVKINHYWDRGLPDLTAPDQDHVLFPDGPRSDDPLGIAYREASRGKRSTLKAGSSLPLGGKIEATVLASGTKVIDSTGESKNPICSDSPSDLPVDTSDNAQSIALRLRFGKFDFLDCGDLTWNIERQLVCPTDRIGAIDLYQVTHHGMSISNHPTLVRTIAPTVTVMNNGPKKGGDPKTVQLLRSIPSIQAAYQLHKNVATSASDNTDPALIANTDPAGGQFLRVTVAPDGESFTVRIGAEGSPRTFATK